MKNITNKLNKDVENKINEIEKIKHKLAEVDKNLLLAQNSESYQAREAETKRQISDALKSKIEKAIDRESALLKKVEELQSSFGHSSEREMTLVRQVRELKLDREESIKRENNYLAQVDKLTDSESILRKQMDHALGHVSSLRKQINEADAKYTQLNEDKLNTTSLSNTDTETNKNMNLERKIQSLISEIDKLKHTVKCLKTKSFNELDN